MRKLVLHLAIVCSTFGVSVCLTNLWNALRAADLSIPTLPLPVSKDAGTVSSAEPGLVEIYRDYDSAQTNHDSAFFERVETDDFVLFPADSKPLSRTEDIQLMNSGATNIVYQSDDVKMEVHSNTAIVTGRMTATHGDGYSYSWRWLDICVKRHGRWQIQSTTQLD